MGVWGPSTAASSGHGRGTQIGSAREQSSSPPRSAHGRPPPPHKPLNGAAMHVLSNSACCLLLPAVGGGLFCLCRLRAAACVCLLLPAVGGGSWLHVCVCPACACACLSACLLPLPACCVCVCGGRVLFCCLPVCLPAVCLPAERKKERTTSVARRALRGRAVYYATPHRLATPPEEDGRRHPYPYPYAPVPLGRGSSALLGAGGAWCSSQRRERRMAPVQVAARVWSLLRQRWA